MATDHIKTRIALNPSLRELMQASSEEQYLDVELTLEETEEALRLARKEKHFILRRQAYAESLSKKVTYIKKTAEELFEDFKAKGFTFQNTEHEKTVKNLCCFFARDARFKGNLDKGILFMGKAGTGKTEIMRFFQANQNFSFRLEAMLDIQFDYKMSGEEGVKPYNVNFKTAANQFGGTDYGYCFDDLGTEEIPARHFGESKNIFSEIIQVRYHNQLPFNSTHAITNKNEDELKQLYGSRAYDRFKEMFNVIVFTHESFR